jgi:ribonuclease HI
MPRIVEDALVIYTDGSLYPRGRKGGYGAVFVHIDTVGRESVVFEHAPPGIRGATGNRMELQACIDALTLAPQQECFHAVSKVVIRTDSRYVARNCLNALGSWRKDGWKNFHGRPLDNADLWKSFVREHGKIRKRVLIEWVKGHGKGKAGDPYNIRADKLAKESARSPLSQTVFHSSVRRKLGSAHTRTGSVRLLGQTMVVYIVEAQRMRVQRTWKYRYQVASQGSPDHLAIDWIYSQEHMRDGHYYEVLVNDDMDHPQVLRMLRDVDPKELASSSVVAPRATY